MQDEVKKEPGDTRSFFLVTSEAPGDPGGQDWKMVVLASSSDEAIRKAQPYIGSGLYEATKVAS